MKNEVKLNCFRRLIASYVTALLLVLVAFQFAIAQPAVQLGAGSYAAYPPLHEAEKPYYTGTDAWGDLTQKVINQKLYVVDTTTRAIPSTDWWTTLITTQWSGNLWAYPQMVKAEPYGLFVEFPKTWNTGTEPGRRFLASSRLTIAGEDFSPESALARRWGAWTFDWIMKDSFDPTKQLAVTMGHGLPFTWIECTKVKPTISFDATATFFKDDGSAQTFPATTDHFGILVNGDHYGVFAPTGTQFAINGNIITATFPSANGYVVIGTLPTAADLSLFNTYAYTIPRDSKVSWVYNEDGGKMDITWELVPENLRGGTQMNFIQGWLPHSYKKTTRDFSFNALEFATPRGKLKCATGNKFKITYDFNGLVPGLPTPAVETGIPNPYRPEVLNELVNNYKTKTGYGVDTYWGGKDLLNYARYMQLAAETGNTEAFDIFKAKLKEALTDWYTYSPGEDAHYFSWYTNWGSFLGHNTRDNNFPGIDILQDHAFCYAYHIYAASILFMYDEEFMNKYKDFVKMQILDYANYNRGDKRFPYFRSMDPWAGHSYSGGMGDPNGNGEESSSEGMQAWGAMYLYGIVTGDKAVRDAGIFGYVQEAQGVGEYWFDRSHIPANGGQGNYDYTKYDKPYNSNLTSNGIGWWTYFSGDNFWMHSIQWIPYSPFLKYLSEDVNFARWDYSTMWNTKTVGGWDSDLGNTPDIAAITLSYLQIFDADSAASVYDRLWNQGKAGAKASDNNTFSYWYMHSHRTLGEIQWNQHTNMPSSTVYFNARTNKTTVVVYNPASTEQLCKVYNNGVMYASFNVPAKKMIAHKLDAALTSISVTAPKKTVPTGTTLQLTAQGLDQYGAKSNTTVTWSVSGGGTINSTGLFTAGSTVNNNVVVSAKSGTITGTFNLRVNTAPVLTTINITPSVPRADIGKPYQFAAAGLDQYGDPFTIAPAWTVSGGGTITAGGLYSPTTPGGPFNLTGTSGSVSKTVQISTSYPLSNIALLKPSTASSSSTVNILSNANDGNIESRWESDWADNQWLKIDLGGNFELEKIVLTWEAAYAKVYNIEVSTDNVSFTPLYSTANSLGGKEEISVTGTGRYVRLNMVTRATIWGNSIKEFEVYGMPPKTGGAVLSTLLVTPEVVEMKDNVTQQFTAKGYDQFGNLMTVSPSWSVVGKGSISPTGLYTPNGGGLYLQPSFKIVANQNSLVATATVVVEEVKKLMKIDIQPLSTATNRIDMALGSSYQFSYIGFNQFGTPFADPITWSASGGGSINSSGVYTSNATGNFMIFGKSGAISDTAHVTVKPFAEVNLALFKPAKVSSVEADDANKKGASAVDKKMDTRWVSKYTDNEWIYVDLQAAYKLNKVVIYWEGTNAYGKDYDIQVSNDALSWTTVSSIIGGDGGQDIVPFTETVGQYVRMRGVHRPNGWGYAMYEFEVYGTGTAGNQNPVVNISSPANNAVFTGLNPIAVTATASDSDGTISKVEFFAGTTPIGTDTSSPYSVSWTPASTGSYALTAKAFDNLNATSTSATVNITVNPVSGGQAIPGKIEAESYLAMSGVAKENTSDTGGGQNVGYINAGDWMDYSVNVSAAGSYAVQLRLAGWSTTAQLQLKSGSTVLATVNVPNNGGGQNWSTTDATVTLAAGSQTLRVHVVNGGFNFNWMSFSNGGNASPSVSITTPATNDVFTGLNPITVSASASDTDGTISNVEFFAGTAPIGSDNTSPYSISWTPTAYGPYVLTAKASDNQNASTTSTAVNITVNEAGGGGQAIPGKIEAESYSSMSGIATENTADTGGGQNISYIDANDWLDYSVNVQNAGSYTVEFRLAGWSTSAQLQLKNGSTVLATVNAPNNGGGQSWSTVNATVSLTAGSQTLRVHIANGGFNFNWMNFVFVGNASPSVSISAPLNNEVFTGLNPITVSANASDSDGTISKVEFFKGTTPIGTDNTSPYSISWTPAATGTYALTAKAFDNLNATTTSAAVNITVNPASSGMAIPGKIEAESYATMSGVAKENTGDTGGGENIGYIDAGDWMDYPVTVAAAGTYTVQFRIACWNASAQLQLKNGSTVLNTTTLTPTGGGQSWTTVNSTVTLPAGNITLRVHVVTGGFNFNWMNFTSGSGARMSFKDVYQSTPQDEKIVVFPNPAREILFIRGVKANSSIIIRDVTGKEVQKSRILEDEVSIKDLPPGTYILHVNDGKQSAIMRVVKN